MSSTLPLRTLLAMILTGNAPKGLSGRPKRPKCRGAPYSSWRDAPAFSEPPQGFRMTDSAWWAPHVPADGRRILLARGRITAAVRAWFGGRGFVEGETAILQVSPG